MSSKDSSIDIKKTILSSLPPKLVDDYLINNRIHIQSYNKNQIIHLEGEVCRQIEIIIEGQIVINRIGIDGDLMTINHFHQGHIIGANLIFLPQTTIL